MQAIVIPYDNEPYTIHFDREDATFEYDELKNLLTTIPHPFSWFEIVKVIVGGQICQMYVDENGKMRDGWLNRINDIASELYGNPVDVIVGDVVLFADMSDADTYLFTDEKAQAIIDYLGS